MAQPEAGARYPSARNELVREVHEFPYVVVFFVLALSTEHNSAMSIRQVADELRPPKWDEGSVCVRSHMPHLNVCFVDVGWWSASGRDYHFAVEGDSSHSPNGERPGSELGMRSSIFADPQLV